MRTIVRYAVELMSLPERRDTVQGLRRGLSVLRTLSEATGPMTSADIARDAALNRATTRRLLLTLRDEGYVLDDGVRFRLSPRVLEIGRAFLSSLGLDEIAHPAMVELARATHESTSIAVLDGDEIVYVARVPSQRVMTISLALGSRLPAYATSMGRVLLAHVPETELDAVLARIRLEKLTPHTVDDLTQLRHRIDQARLQGWALVDQELEVGVRSVAVPLTNRSGRAFAAINVAGHATRVSRITLQRIHLPLLRRTAERIMEELRF